MVPRRYLSLLLKTSNNLKNFNIIHEVTLLKPYARFVHHKGADFDAVILRLIELLQYGSCLLYNTSTLLLLWRRVDQRFNCTFLVTENTQSFSVTHYSKLLNWPTETWCVQKHQQLIPRISVIYIVCWTDNFKISPIWHTWKWLCIYFVMHMCYNIHCESKKTVPLLFLL